MSPSLKVIVPYARNIREPETKIVSEHIPSRTVSGCEEWAICLRKCRWPSFHTSLSHAVDVEVDVKSKRNLQRFVQKIRTRPGASLIGNSAMPRTAHSSKVMNKYDCLVHRFAPQLLVRTAGPIAPNSDDQVHLQLVPIQDLLLLREERLNVPAAVDVAT